MIRICGIALLSLLLCASAAFASDKILIVSSDATWPPMEFLNPHKHVIGYSTDYINAVAKEAGMKIAVRNAAWDGIFAALESNQTDIIASSVTITEKRKKAMDFSEPYCEVRQAVIVPVGSPVKNLQDLKGLKVGGQIGTTGLIETLPKAKMDSLVTVKTYDEIGLALEDLAKGNIDAVICDSPVAGYFVNKKMEYKGKLQLAYITDDVEYYGFAVRKGNQAILDKLNKGIQAVKSKGIEKKLMDSWFGSNR